MLLYTVFVDFFAHIVDISVGHMPGSEIAGTYVCIFSALVDSIKQFPQIYLQANFSEVIFKS